MDEGKNRNDSPVPVPKPRRHILMGNEFNGKTSYENVSIDLINKNIDIKNENLQNNSKNKIPLNKTFLMAASPSSSSSPPPSPSAGTTGSTNSDAHPQNVLTELNDLHSASKDSNRNLASTLDEVNKLSNIYSDDENVKQKPVPAPRRSNASSLERDSNLASASSSTGAISKISNKNLYPSLENEKKSKYSGSYSFVADETDSMDGGAPPKYSLNKNAMSMSNSSLASTQSGSSNTTESSPSAKYHTTSPGRLLKALGATSKLLTESITERVATRTKDAKHKIDKMHKNSRDRLAETTKIASNKMKNVRKNFHSTIELTQNLSLGRSHKKGTFNNKNADGSTSSSSGSSKQDGKHMPEFDADRPQTAPANDELFKSIKFNSPLTNKTNNCMNINNAESSYEIPKSIRSTISSSSSENTVDAGRASLPIAKATSSQPPSYDEIMRADSATSSSNTSKSADDVRPQPIARNRSKNLVSAPNSYENHEIVKKAPPIKRSDSSSSDNDADYAVPCPNFPAPVLSEGIYGKLRSQADDVANEVNSASPSVQAPTRSKRRKDYEQTELRLKLNEAASPVASNRATADSNEFVASNKIPPLFARDVSEDFTEKLRLAEKSIPSPDRSDSWSYYETNSDELSSTPEPIYANDCNTHVDASPSREPVYGVLYNIDSTDEGAMLVPKAVERKRRSARLSDQYAKVDKSKKESNQSLANGGGACADCSTEILKELDPLDRKTFDKLFTNKSNELILLENLLGEETYGTCTDDHSFAYTSLETSDDDEDINELPIPPERLDSLPEGENEDASEAVCRKGAAGQSTQNDENRKTVIVHQNVKLHSGSSENLVDPMNVSTTSTSSTAATEDDGGRTKSRWFLSTFDSDSKSKADKKSLGESSEEIDKKLISAKPSMMSSMFSNVKNKMEGIKRKTSFRSASQKVEVKTILEMVPRPCLTQRLILHEGHLIRLPNRQDIMKELHPRKAYIRDRKFQAFFDKDMRQPKENIPLEWITTIQCVNSQKGSNNLLDIYSFEITTAIPKNVGDSLTNPNIVMTSTNSGNTKTQRVCHIYGVAKESERFIWMQKLLESVTEVFPPGFSSRFYRAGWCYSKNSITSKWSGAWILLQKEKRRLLFYNYLDMNLECMDLRKARCLVLKESDDSINNLHVESGPTLMIDCPPYAMYFIMTSPRETKIWRHIIQEVAHNNGPSLKEQQLTKDNVPVLVDKCINFIYAHGSMSEGIYRKSGSENSIHKLLKIFRTDAFSAQIIRNDYNEHDVANALKRFMRDLPDRLLGKYTVSLISVSEMKDVREKINAYKELLSRLPTIEYHTLRKLLGHLHFIQTQKEHNKMDVANLAIVWGPTLLQDKQSENHYSQTEADVIIDLIKYYKNLYAMSPEEAAKEQMMLQVLQKYHAAAENLNDTMKKSGDLKVWITIDANPDNETEEKQQINVTLTPNKTVNDICKELAPHMKREAFKLTLSEIILDGTLHRPLHHSEKVFDIVLKWSYWPEADRKNNYLRLRPTKFMNEVERALKMLPTVSLNKELKFADCKTKSFKMYTLELNDGKITVLKKEKNTIVKVREIDLLKATAYLGCEKKRDFQLRWAITLIEDDIANKTNLRTRESPFIGHVIAGTDANDQIVWFSSILHSLYGDNIMPSPEIIIP